MAALIAKYNSYEIECLQVITISRHNNPAETPVKTSPSRELLLSAEIMGKKWKIPVHTQNKVAHDVAVATLDVIKERHIDTVLMGWKGSTNTPGRIFGNVVDTIIRQATSELLLVRLGKSSNPINFKRCLVPMAGGPNSKIALKLLPPLVTFNKKLEIRLTQVFSPSTTQNDTKGLKAAKRLLVNRYKLSNKVEATPIKATSVSQGVINLVKSQGFVLVVLGASGEGM